MVGSLIFIIGFIVMAIGFILIIYKFLYKQNMNKALEGEGHAGLFDPGMLLKSLAFIGVIVMLIISLVKIGDLQTSLNNQNNLISQLTQRIWGLENDISGLEDQIDDFTASQDLIQSFSYSVTGIDNSGDIEYLIEFSLLEVASGTSVTLVLIDNGLIESQIPVTSNSLNFSTEVLLKDQHDYELYVLTQGSSIHQEELGTIEVANDFTGRFDLDLSGSSSNNLFDFDLDVKNYYIGSYSVKIKTVTYEVYVNNVLSKTVTIDEASYTSDTYEIFRANNIEFNASDQDQISFVVTVTDNMDRVYTATRNLFE